MAITVTDESRAVAQALDIRKWRYLLPAPAWFLIALTIRLALVHVSRGVEFDGRYYLLYAHSIGAGDWFHPSLQWAPYPPLYPALIAVLHGTGLTWARSGYAISMVSGSGLVAVLFLMTRYVLGGGAGHAAAACLALNVHLIRYSDAVLSESLYYLLLACALYFVIRVTMRKPSESAAPHFWYLAATFAAFGLAITLTRYAGLLFLPALLLTCVFVLGWRRHRALNLALLVGIVVSVSTIVVVTTLVAHRQNEVAARALRADPAISRSWAPPLVIRQPGLRWSLPNYLTEEMYWGLRDGVLDPARENKVRLSSYSESPVTFVRDNMKLMSLSVMRRIRRDLNTGMITDDGQFSGIYIHNWNPAPLMPWYLVILFTLGVYWAGKVRTSIPIVMLLPIVLLLSANPLFTDDPRYNVPVLLAFIPLCAYGALMLFRLSFRDERASVLRYVLLGLAAALYLSDVVFVHPI